MTLRELLSERTFADERKDASHPIQVEVERKFTKIIYDTEMKEKLENFEKTCGILNKKFDEIKKILQGKKVIVIHGVDLSLDNENTLTVHIYCSWHREEPEDKDRYHTITSGDGWSVNLTRENFSADKEVYKKFINGDIDTLIKAKHGAGRWNLYRGQTFWFGKDFNIGFKLTDDYKIVDATEEDSKNYKEYSGRMIADWLWTYDMPSQSGKNKDQSILTISKKAKEKFDTSARLAKWINDHPDKKTKFSALMEKSLGKRRW